MFPVIVCSVSLFTLSEANLLLNVLGFTNNVLKPFNVRKLIIEAWGPGALHQDPR